MKNSDKHAREKLMVSGAGALSDAELLAVVIREGTEALSAVELAEKILEEFGGAGLRDGMDAQGGVEAQEGRDFRERTGSRERAGRQERVGAQGASGLRNGAGAQEKTGALAAIASADVQRIRRAGGCGTVRAVSIAAACELARRITAEKALSVSAINSKEDVVKLFAGIAELPHEEFWALYLTSGGRVIDRARLSQGGVAGTVVDHKLVVKRAVELLASSLILVHNHPSGIAQPSKEDISITETMRAAAALFDINIIDHIIVSRGGAFSFAERGMMGSKD